MAKKVKVDKKIIDEILKEKGIKYSEWLEEKHAELFNENQKVLKEKIKKANQYDELNK